MPQKAYKNRRTTRLVPPQSIQAEATIVRLADAAALNRDELLGLAGKIEGDVRRTILKRPKLPAGLVLQFAGVSDEKVRRVILRARRTGKQ